MGTPSSAFSDSVMFDVSIIGKESQGSESSNPSSVSAKSTSSMDQPLRFSDGLVPFFAAMEKSLSPTPVSVTQTSISSMDQPFRFSDGAVYIFAAFRSWFG